MHAWHFSPATIGFGDRPTVLLESSFKSAVGTPQLGQGRVSGLANCHRQFSLYQLSYTLMISRQATVYSLAMLDSSRNTLTLAR
jgi:hypothetical protein